MAEMKLTVLMDNNTYIDRYYLGEPAACYLLETGERTILLDTGYSACTLENARRMGVDLSRVTDIVLSHGHDDHTGGLLPFLSAFPQPVRLFAHPDAFLPKRFDGRSVGVPFDPAALPAHAELRLSRGPAELAPGVLFLGEIPRTNPLEAPPVGETLRGGTWEPDRLLDDTALALATKSGLFLLTGMARMRAFATCCNTPFPSQGKRALRAYLAAFTCLSPARSSILCLRALRSSVQKRSIPATAPPLP